MWGSDTSSPNRNEILHIGIRRPLSTT